MTPTWLTDTVTSDLGRALRYTLLWGLEGVELRTVGGPADRVPYVNEDKVRRRLETEEVPVVAIVPGLFERTVRARAAWLNEVAQFDETLAFCSRIGCGRVVVSAFVAADEATAEDRTTAAEALRRLGDKAAGRGVTVAVLNQTGGAHPTGTALARLLAAVGHPAVRAAWCPVAAARSGEDPAQGLTALAGRIDLVRCANGVAAASDWTAAALTEGVVDWPAHLRRLRAQGFGGPVSLDVNLDPRPLHGLRMASDLIRMLRLVAQDTP